MAGGTNQELDRPRGAFRLLGATAELYWRFPLLFLILASAVLIPYELIVLLGTGHGPLARPQDGFVVGQILGLTSIALVSPLVSALHVHAVREIWDGNTPQPEAVAKRSLAVLPVVSAAVVISYLGTMLGFLALIVPGILLLLRWSVVAQAAALEGSGWEGALRRSAALTDGHYGHVFGVLFLVTLVGFSPTFAIGRVFGHDDTTLASFAVGTAVEVLVWSFGALATALLFFDLTVRLEIKEKLPAAQPARIAGVAVSATAGTGAEPTGHPLDPASYSDETRPPGWYVNPDSPWRMRYWAADGKPGWSKRTAKTPKDILATWRDLRSTR